MNIRSLQFIGRKLRPVELALLVKYILRIKRKEIRLSDGRMYYIDPVSDLGLKLQSEAQYEPEMTRAISEILQAGDTFVDLGCNEGYFSVFAAIRVGNSGRVFAIEPQERLWKIILRNSIINSLTNIHLIPFGIGSKRQNIPLQLYPSINSGASGFSPKLNFRISFARLRKKFYGIQDAEVLTLDDCIHIFPDQMKLIKIDIEGYELEAIKGAQKLLSERIIQNLLIEIHPEALKGMNQSEQEIDKFLRSYGYSKKVIKSDNLYLYFRA